MSDKIYSVPGEWKSRAYVDDAKYRAMYERSLKDPNGFWAEEAKRLYWYKAPTKIKNTSYAPDNVSIKWFEDGVTNVSYNCIDRHLGKRANQTAIIWEGDDPKDDKKITYQELHDETCRMANILRNRNVSEGRPRHHLHADDPRGRLRDARLRAYRRDPFGGVRRLLARTRLPAASRTASRTSSSRPTRACAADARCRSRPMSMRRSPRSAVSIM